MATLTILRLNVTNVLGLDNTVAASGGDQGQIDYYLNEGVRQVLLDTSCYITSTTVTPGATADYTLTTPILLIKSMYFTSGGTQYNLTQKSLQEIIDYRRAAGSSSPTLYYHLAGTNLLMWFPTPAAADVLTLYYVPYPTALSAGSDDPSGVTLGGIPVEQHKLIEAYALWKLADMSDNLNSQKGELYKARYTQGVGMFRRDLTKRGGPLASVPLPSRRRGQAWVPRPDQIGA